MDRSEILTDRSSDIIGAVTHMKKKGTLRIVIIGFIVGVALLIIGSFAFGGNNGEKNAGNESAAQISVSFAEYKEEVRREIEETCLKIRGVNSAHAVVFFDGAGESIYAQNTQTGSTEKNEYVIIGSGSGSHALYLGESLPIISGIGVVCNTGGSDAVKNEIAALLSAAYGLPLTRVYVSEG